MKIDETGRRRFCRMSVGAGVRVVILGGCCGQAAARAGVNAAVGASIAAVRVRKWPVQPHVQRAFIGIGHEIAHLGHLQDRTAHALAKHFVPGAQSLQVGHGHDGAGAVQLFQQFLLLDTVLEKGGQLGVHVGKHG